MPGFFITNTKEIPELHNYCDSNCVQGQMEYKDWKVSWNVLNKYKNDKIFCQDDERLIVLDGVILNKTSLMSEYAKDEWLETVSEMCSADEEWFKKLRGVFAGAIMDKKTGMWYCFTDQCGEHLLMTYTNGGEVAFGCQLNYFSDWMKLRGIKPEPDPDWMKDIVSFGYMRDAYTAICGVRRVYPGSYFKYNTIDCSEGEYVYHRLTKARQLKISDDKAIELLDECFRNAVRRIVRKDMEYGYNTIVDISGGLDSRMNAAVAAAEGGKNIVGLTYAQSHSEDQTIADKVASCLQIEHLFYSMDGGDVLKQIDALMFMNNGFNYYYGITGGMRALEILSKDRFGAEIWGLLGDIYEGAMVLDTGKELQWDYGRFRTSSRFSDIQEPKIRHDFEDNELLWFYIRGMLAGMNTGQIRQNYVEPLSPYGDVEFMELCFSLPEQKRIKDHIYRKWMRKCYPDMAKLAYTGTGVPVLAGDLDKPLSFIRSAYRYVYTKIFGAKRYWSMNPLNTWYEENSQLRDFFDEYYYSNLEVLSTVPELKEKTELLYGGSVSEKMIALSVISAFKQYIA